MSEKTEVHLLRQRLVTLEDIVQDLDRGAGRAEEKLRDKIFIAALQKLVQFCDDDGPGREVIARTVECANLWADGAMKGVRK